MRELRFRAWDEENKIFHYFTLFDVWKNVAFPTHVVTDHKIYYLEGKPIDQYTGLKDKTEKEIYEGDIDSKGRVVSYLVNMSGFYLMKEGVGIHLSHDQVVLKGCLKHIEIIGNRHEEFKLFEVKQ